MLKVLIADVRSVTLKVSLDLNECFQRLTCQQVGVDQRGEHSQYCSMLTVTQGMPPAIEPFEASLVC